MTTEQTETNGLQLPTAKDWEGYFNQGLFGESPQATSLAKPVDLPQTKIPNPRQEKLKRVERICWKTAGVGLAGLAVFGCATTAPGVIEGISVAAEKLPQQIVSTVARIPRTIIVEAGGGAQFVFHTLTGAYPEAETPRNMFCGLPSLTFLVGGALAILRKRAQGNTMIEDED